MTSGVALCEKPVVSDLVFGVFVSDLTLSGLKLKSDWGHKK